MRRWGAAALGRWSLGGLWCILCTAATLRAQTSLHLEPSSADSAAPERPSVSSPQRPSASAPQRLSAPAPIRYGKWLALGGSLAAAFLADQRHRDANAQYDALQSRCDAVPSGCVVSGGRYVDPVDEGLYQDTRRLDHQAARYLVGAEALFAASAAGFVWELMHHHDEPRNIPFAPRVERSADRVQLGMSVRF